MSNHSDVVRKDSIAVGHGFQSRCRSVVPRQCELQSKFGVQPVGGGYDLQLLEDGNCAVVCASETSA